MDFRARLVCVAGNSVYGDAAFSFGKQSHYEYGGIVVGVERVRKNFGVVVHRGDDFCRSGKRAVFRNRKRNPQIRIFHGDFCFAFEFFGWGLYFCGVQTIGAIMFFIVLMPPLYYVFIGLWRENWMLLFTGILFGIVHFCHVYGNFKM